MHGEYIPDILARLEHAAGGWLTPVSGPLALGQLVPALQAAAAATSGQTSRQWAHAANATSARLWVAGDVGADRDFWDDLHATVAQAAAAQPHTATAN
ncbi:hypothetical protein ACIG5E_34220 [Kitasatospora sp. NPDC053057]|uniref:hypothetical protein n=1 Tax=Kitasatospora sp. NPDC053057 TaxID=3364062 RepID=UPI0037CBB0F4